VRLNTCYTAQPNQQTGDATMTSATRRPVLPSNLPPLGFHEIRAYLWFGVAGLLVLLLGVLGRVTAIRWAIVFLLACWLVVAARGLFRRSAPSPGMEQKAVNTQVRLFYLVVAAFLVGFAFWGRRLGLSWSVVIGALLLIDAFANMIASLTDYWRLSMFGHSIGLMICGFAFPFVEKSKWPVLLGGSLLVGSLLAAAILYWQVRSHRTSSISSG
jgi:hypothetical protein